MLEARRTRIVLAVLLVAAVALITVDFRDGGDSAAHGAGGRVLGIIPEFLTDRESLYGAVETVVVPDMPTRKLRMFEESDAFAVLPGGIGTLEEIVELLSWKRLDLHRKPVVFLNIQGFWDPLFELFRHTIDARLTPAAFTGAYAAVERVEDMLPALEAQADEV